MSDPTIKLVYCFYIFNRDRTPTTTSVNQINTSLIASIKKQWHSLRFHYGRPVAVEFQAAFVMEMCSEAFLIHNWKRSEFD